MEIQNEDVNALRFAGHLLSCDPVPLDRRKRGQHDVLKALVIGEEMKHSIGSDTGTIATAVREVRPEFKRQQAENYLSGRFTPPHDVIVSIARRRALPELRALAEWPWPLLSMEKLRLAEIEKLANPPYETVFRLPNDRAPSYNRRNRSRWHLPQKFDPDGNWLEPPSKPEEFWLNLLRFRAAKALNDFHSVNAHLWNVIKMLPSIGTHRAVAPHAERLYACIRMLVLRGDPQFLWFSVHWDSVRRSIARENYGSSSLEKPFRNVFRGNDSHLGRPYPLTDLHRKLEALSFPDPRLPSISWQEALQRLR
jgi:hypothetical protein